MLQVLSDLKAAAGELGLGPRPLHVNVNQEEGELEVTVQDGLEGESPPEKMYIAVEYVKRGLETMRRSFCLFYVQICHALTDCDHLF